MGARREPLSPELGAIIEQAYRLFACPPPPDLGVCQGCCMWPEIEADFLNHAPRDLTEAYVRDWYFAAVASKDGLIVHKPIACWIMPRVLEILAKGQEVASVGDEVVLQRLAAGDSDRWSADQNALLTRFKEAYLDLIPQRCDHVMLDDALCMFALAGFAAPAMTDQIMGWSDEVLTQVLHQDWIGSCIRPSIWRTAFWEANSDAAQHVWNWYLSDALLERMIKIALAEDLPDEICQKASEVERLLISQR
ncbi:hypothetical protein [Actibacterium pelagium]|uniref:Uncharacterized protein n=1 Tax=Actibacterium pelagium TaxID=2029103 RepID=A0A917AGC5_9RHOB|nr:hypothetical protein [Actibacterium pelagium]GGE48922.1 hypothetical protein GCM10011517_15950 [Actibacterium pelagium]